MTPAIQSQIRDELRIRKLALSYFGHQGIQDLAVLGAILGNNIREIGRYKVTCDGSLVQGQYTIYELVHFGILFATGRTKSRCTRRRRHLCKNTQQPTGTSTGDNKQGEVVTKIYPTLLASLFPAVVFKALRKKSRQLPRLSEENSDDEREEQEASSPSASSLFALSSLRRFRRGSCSSSGSGDYSSLCASGSSSMFLRRDSSDSTASGHSITNTHTTMTSDVHQDPFLVSAGSVVTLLIKNRLHRVKDLPMPRELCFVGAVSLPLPPALRAMHVAWTMDFLATKATTQRRQRRQMKVKDAASSATTTTTAPLGGLEFRQDVYAHKMAVARTVRAQQLKHRQQQEQNNSSSSSSSPSVPPQVQQNRLSLSMGQPRHSFLIPAQIKEEEEEEDFEEETLASPPSPKTLSFDPSSTTTTASAAYNNVTSATSATSTSTTTATTANSAHHTRSIRQSKRLMQQILSLENKVPRSVRKWAVVARGCFSHELVSEDRLVQEWVDKQRIQVVLACGGGSGGGSGGGEAYSRQQHSFAEGIRLGGTNTYGEMVSRPTSGVHGTDNRMSASQQMLSMHLWLSVLVSPLSPRQMVYDRFME
ncbi:hypothetical protein CPB97_008210 [Podila verticillata]|nr:hypothetical protein CPB97_008210 [Podila verticillata]